ncbi:hypothetical protein NKR23_g1844 [Pleurostoma richardsiae]|uniref:RRM domain-containing protein n=1 Tax=Pleurostoma richardsiae TaxID=41990 RepID=A0AA38SBG8_9PEZI|nr:hypothetical protein NKR23_g1844 [Pleurostoma richardsiae]
MKRKADDSELAAPAGDAAALKDRKKAGSKKRRLSEPEDAVSVGAEKAAKKAKKEKKDKDKEGKKEKKDRKDKEAKKEKKAEKSAEDELEKKVKKVKKDKSTDEAEDKKEKKAEKAERKAKKDKKSKAGKDADPEVLEDAAAPPPAASIDGDDKKAAKTTNGAVDDAAKTKKSKKEKKDKKDKKEKKDKKKKETEEAEPAADQNDEGEAAQSGKREKYILFIGNLPYSATADALRNHLASVKPTSVRLLTQRDDPSKSRGIAFVEFGTYGHMRTCLDKFHHTEFKDPASGQSRKINVELTAGGGGKKSEARKEKIKAKNEDLNEERAKRKEAEDKQSKEKAAEEEDMVHPSRRGIVPSW